MNKPYTNIARRLGRPAATSRHLAAGFAASMALLGVIASTAASAQQGFSQTFVVDAERYDGTWFEVARTPNAFQDNALDRSGVTYGPCRDTTASYSLRGSSFVDIRNVCTRDAADGSGATFREVINGVGVVQPGESGRKLKIAFGNAFERFLQRLFTGGGSPYWIYGLGEPNAAGDYAWALVSGPARDAIFILSREPELDPASLQAAIELAEVEGLPTEDLIFTQTAE